MRAISEYVVGNVYQFNIKLDGSKPKIWRRVQVPENYTFEKLHAAIQCSMGWENIHLHQFTIKCEANNNATRISKQFDDDDIDDEYFTDESTAKICDYFSMINNKSKYVYDFGDGWVHSVLLERIIPADAGTMYPVCIAGKRACPPEDCGGIWGFSGILEMLEDPSNPEYAEGAQYGQFDPEYFKSSDVIFYELN